MRFKERLKQKWNIQNDWDFWMIMLTFSMAGMAIMPARKVIFHLVGITPQTPLWVKILVYVPLIPPAYQLGLLLFGTLLGQFRFFWEKEKQLVRFLIGRKNIKH